MASGINVSDKVTETFTALSKRAFTIMVLNINADMTDIVVEKTLPPSSGDPEAEWKDFIKTVPEADCRYIICDFQWKETPTVTKSKICMILWSPENAPIRSKMIYASSQESVSQKMDVQRSIQATEFDELSYSAVKDIVSK